MTTSHKHRHYHWNPKGGIEHTHKHEEGHHE